MGGNKKPRVTSGGARKNHGPKRKLFHEWNSTMRIHFGKAGLLNKYNSLESFMLSCQARGLKNGSKEDWDNRFHTFKELKTKEEQDRWLENCKEYKDPVASKPKPIKA